MKNILRCPRCFSPLILGEGYRNYMNLVDHVCSPNSKAQPHEYFVCSSEICPTRIVDDFWDPYGDYYTNETWQNDFFVLNCDRALNSGSRHFELQSHKKYITVFHLILFKIDIELTPQWDPPGLHLTGYSPKITMSVRKSLKNSWVNYIPGIRMFFFCLRNFDEKLKKYLDNPSNDYLAKDLMSELIPEHWDRRWWKLLSCWCNNRKVPGLKETLKKSFNK